MNTVRHRQRGATLLEALLAFLVVSVGMLMLARLQSSLRLETDLARQRSEAVRLAQQDMEAQRHFSSLASPSSGSGHGHADIASADSHLLPAELGLVSNTDYALTRAVDTDAATGYKALTVDIGWHDRRGAAQTFQLHSIIARNPPTLAATLALPRSRLAAHGPLGRSVHVPRTAIDLGDGRSLFRPTATGGLGWIVDNASGAIVASCTDVAATTAPDATDCSDVPAQRISGVIRFSLAAPPSATLANDVPRPLAVVMSAGADPSARGAGCTAESMKEVSIGSGLTERRISVAADARPEAWGLSGWTELGERFVAYHCAALRLGGVGAVTRIDLQPVGWTLGHGTDGLRLCAYPAQGDADSAAAQGLPITRNFLLVRGPEDCPAGTREPAREAGTDPATANLVTVRLATSLGG